MNSILRHLEQIYECLTLLDQKGVGMVADELRQVKLRGGTVYLCGNGGSHATASHFSNDLSKMCGIKSMCLGDAIPTILAYGNDDGWDRMYGNALNGLVEKRDAVIGISCSGNSKNVVNALKVGKEVGAATIALTGIDQHSKVGEVGVDIIVHAVSEDIRVQEDVHLFICHAIVRTLQEHA